MRHETAAAMPLMMVAVIAVAALLVPASAADASEAYDTDLGDMYSMTVQFVFAGSDAESVEWDFGDGTPHSTEWNPAHTYAETGEYIVTQTAYNSYNGGSESMMSIRIAVLGYPTVSFDSRDGTEVDDIRLSSPKGVAERPEDPSRTGFVFTGWYTDEGCTSLFDWSSQVTRSFVLHAGWEPAEAPVCVVSFDCDGGSIPVEPVTVGSGSEFEVPGYEGTRGGCAFAGWMLDGTLMEPGTRILVGSDTLLTASWTQSSPEDDGSGSFIEENPVTIAAAVIALVMAALIAIRITRS